MPAARGQHLFVGHGHKGGIYKCKYSLATKNWVTLQGGHGRRSTAAGYPSEASDHASWTQPIPLENSPPMTFQKRHGWNDTGHGTSWVCDCAFLKEWVTTFKSLYLYMSNVLHLRVNIRVGLDFDSDFVKSLRGELWSWPTGRWRWWANCSKCVGESGGVCWVVRRPAAHRSYI